MNPPTLPADLLRDEGNAARMALRIGANADLRGTPGHLRHLAQEGQGVRVWPDLVGVTASSLDPNGPAVTYALIGDTSGGGFTINAATGTLAFVTAPNFEVPTDSGANNVYDVVVQVADGSGGADTQALAVTVTNVNEAPVITSNGGGTTANVTVVDLDPVRLIQA